MSLVARAAVLLLLGAAILADGAAAASRKAVRETAPKDCTRLNGRFGYYGNPWCTPAEQARWDKWEARRLAVR